MSMLTIPQLKHITGLSYPTLLKFANEHGERILKDNRPHWILPASSVEMYIEDKQTEVDAMRSKLALVLSPS